MGRLGPIFSAVTPLFPHATRCVKTTQMREKSTAKRLVQTGRRRANSKIAGQNGGNLLTEWVRRPWHESGYKGGTTERLFGAKIFLGMVRSRGEVGIVRPRTKFNALCPNGLSVVNATGTGFWSRLSQPGERGRQMSLFTSSAFDIACAGPLD
jgi:hypothetical protein